MIHDGNNRKLFVVLGLVAVLSLGLLLTGCGGDKDVETDPTAGSGDGGIETPTEPMVPETTPEPEVTAPDYAAMDPSEYGIDDVFFAFDEYSLGNDAMAILSRNARVLRETDVTLVIAGHCDERGTVEYNLALGEKRAKVVKEYLVSLGVPASRMDITSYGETKPFAMGSTEHAWGQNRRAHFARR